MKSLQELSLTLEAVTPVWTGGASGAAEPRAPSLRGCLRFWLRALLGGAFGDDLKSLAAAESAVFGGMQLASSIVVRATGTPAIGDALLSQEDFPGIHYMFWSPYQRKRQAILPGERFTVRLHERVFERGSIEVQGCPIDAARSFELAASATWLLLRLGGVGARVRRAAGILQAAESPAGWPEALPPLVSSAATTSDLAVELAAGLRQIQSRLPWSATALTGPSGYDLLHPDVCQIVVADEAFPDWMRAVDWIGRHFLEFRRSQVGDAHSIAALLTHGRLAARSIQRAVLGLPIMFFFKSMFETLTAQGVPPGEARRKSSAVVVPRRGLGRASPLLIRVLRLAGQPPRYAVVMLVFRSRFLPDRDMTVKPQDYSIRPASIPVPSDHRLIDQWIEYLRQQGGTFQPVEF